jgi:hypothetical protein
MAFHRIEPETHSGHIDGSILVGQLAYWNGNVIV